MNKRVILIVLSVVLLNAASGVFAMRYTVALRVAQGVTSGCLIKKGFEVSCEQYNESLKPVSGVSAKPAVDKLVRSQLKYHGISQADEMAIISSAKLSGGYWSASDKAIYVSPLIEVKLEAALAGTAEQRKLINADRKKIADQRASSLYKWSGVGSPLEKSVKAWEDLVNRQESDLNDQDDLNEKYIAKQLGILNHEACHVITGVNPRIYSIGLIPMAVQAGCSTLSYCGNKVFKRQLPTSWKSTIARSGIAVASMPVKVKLIGLGCALYGQYDESNADLFACKNARDKKELEGLRDFFKEDLRVEEFEKAQYQQYSDLDSYSEKNQRRLLRALYLPKDPIHPYPGDRVEMAEKYLKNWDKNHPKDADN
jgi:hypothetical protein